MSTSVSTWDHISNCWMWRFMLFISQCSKLMCYFSSRLLNCFSMAICLNIFHIMYLAHFFYLHLLQGRSYFVRSAFWGDLWNQHTRFIDIWWDLNPLWNDGRAEHPTSSGWSMQVSLFVGTSSSTVYISKMSSCHSNMLGHRCYVATAQTTVGQWLWKFPIGWILINTPRLENAGADAA